MLKSKNKKKLRQINNKTNKLNKTMLIKMKLNYKYHLRKNHLMKNKVQVNQIKMMIVSQLKKEVKMLHHQMTAARLDKRWKGRVMRSFK